MVRRDVVVYVDDLIGQDLRPPDHERVQFSLDGTGYEIDLDRESAEALRRALNRYIAHGRRLTPSGRPVRRVQTDDVDPAAVRAWAGSHGIPVPARGRIPAVVVAQFRAAGH